MKKILMILRNINWDEVNPATYARYILMIVSLINMILTRTGKNPIPVSESQVYQFCTDALTTIVFIVNTWMNNSLTKQAVEADNYLEELKLDRKEEG